MASGGMLCSLYDYHFRYARRNKEIEREGTKRRETDRRKL
jgi:hypothetical protein